MYTTSTASAVAVCIPMSDTMIRGYPCALLRSSDDRFHLRDVPAKQIYKTGGGEMENGDITRGVFCGQGKWRHRSFYSKMKNPHNPKNLYCLFSTTSRACHWWKAVWNRLEDRESNHTVRNKHKSIHYTFSIFRVFVSMPITMAIHSTGDGGGILTWTLSTWMSVLAALCYGLRCTASRARMKRKTHTADRYDQIKGIKTQKIAEKRKKKKKTKKNRNRFYHVG